MFFEGEREGERLIFGSTMREGDASTCGEGGCSCEKEDVDDADGEGDPSALGDMGVPGGDAALCDPM